MFRKGRYIKRQPKSTNLEVQKSLLDYLKSDFPHDEDWVHPLTREVYTIDLIKDQLLLLKNHSPHYYMLIWGVWVTGKQQENIAKAYGVAQSTITKQLSKAMDTLLLLLRHPDLPPEMLPDVTQTLYNQVTTTIKKARRKKNV